jgi:hypothetical protein
VKGLFRARHFAGMRVVAYLFLLSLALSADADTDRAAIRKSIATFNRMSERASVLTRDAEIPDFSRCWQPERSQMYFETQAIRFVTSDVALVDASGNRYGGMSGKQTAPAVFVLKREGADWKVDSLRVLDNCLAIVPLKQ